MHSRFFATLFPPPPPRKASERRNSKFSYAKGKIVFPVRPNSEVARARKSRPALSGRSRSPVSAAKEVLTSSITVEDRFLRCCRMITPGIHYPRPLNLPWKTLIFRHNLMISKAFRGGMFRNSPNVPPYFSHLQSISKIPEYKPTPGLTTSAAIKICNSRRHYGN